MPVPPNTTCATATVIGAFPYSITGVDTTSAPNNPAYGGTGSGKRIVWWTFTYTGTTPVLIQVSNYNTNYTTGISIFSGTCAALTQLIFSLDTFNNPFASNGAFASFVAQPGTTYYISCDDELAGTGGSLALSVFTAPITQGCLIGSYSAGEPSFLASLEILSPVAVSVGFDNSFDNITTIVTPEQNEIFSVAYRTSDGAFLGASAGHVANSGDVIAFFPQLGYNTRTALAARIVSGVAFTIQQILFNAQGQLFLSWVGSVAAVGHHRLQQIDPITFASIKTYDDFSSALITNAATLTPGAFSPDGTLYYFCGIGGTSAGQNQIYALTLSSSTVSNFASYGTWVGGVNPTGDYVNGPSLRTTPSGQVVAVYLHLTAGLGTAANLVIFNPNGTQANVWSIPVTLMGGFSLGTLALSLTPDGTAAWVVIYDSTGVRFIQIQLATGTVVLNVLYKDPYNDTSAHLYSDLLSFNPPGPPPPPPPPPGMAQTIVFDLKASRAWFDAYNPSVIMRTEEEGSGVHNQILGNGDGSVSQYGGTHGDQGNPLLWRLQPGDVDGGDPRRVKAFGDLILKADPQLSTGINVTPVYNDATVLLPNQVLGTGLTGEQPFIVDINSGLAQLARNFSIQVSGSDTVQPIFYFWEPSLVPKDVLTALRATDWEDAGYPGAKWIQGLLISCDCGGVTRSAKVEYDNGNFTETFTLADSLESMIPYSFLNPVIGHLVRLVLVDPGTWILYRLRWVVEPIPEAVSTWAPQPTTHDLPGFMQCERVLLPYMSNAPATLSVSADGVTTTYAVPSSAGVFTKLNILLAPNKGKTFTWKLSTNDGSSNLRVFQKDLEVRIRAWGAQSGYGVVRAFGDLSRENGARI